MGVLKAYRVCRCSGTSRGIGGIRGCRVHWGWQVDWEPDHIGPLSRVPALPLVPLGE